MNLNNYFKKEFKKEIMPIIQEVFPEKYENKALYYALNLGKNKFRAVLPLVTAEITGFNVEKAKLIGAVAEITWTAIILHDDIIDFSTVRRGKPVAQIKFSMNSALCAGVLGLTSGVEILRKNDIYNEVSSYNKAIMRTYQGQILHQEVNITSTEAQLFNIYRLKTSLGVWALTSATKGIKQKRIIAEFCTLLGEAGQIKNDLDDLFSTSAYELSMRDLNEGIYNLPFLLFYKRVNNFDKKTMNKYFGKKEASPDQQKVIRLLDKYNIIKDCIKCSTERTRKAMVLLNKLPDSAGKNLLNEWVKTHSVEKYSLIKKEG